MSHPHILEEQTVTLAEVKMTLEEIQTRDEELSFRAGKTMDHLNHLSLVDVQKKDELIEAIQGIEVPRLKDFHIHKIVNVMPKNVKELAVLLSGYTLTVNKDYQQKIIDALHA